MISSRVLRAVFLIVASSAATGLAGCRAWTRRFAFSGGGSQWSAEEWARIQTLSPLPDPPPDPTNQYVGNEAAIQLGQKFYFDNRFSGIATLTDGLGQSVPYARAGSMMAIIISCAHVPRPEARGLRHFTSAPNTVSIGAGWYDVNSEQTVNAFPRLLLYPPLAVLERPHRFVVVAGRAGE